MAAIETRLSELGDIDCLLHRFTEDSFLVTWSGLVSAEGAVHRAGRLLEGLRTPFLVDGGGATIAASIGVAVRDGRDDSEDDLVANASIAMRQARAAGGGRCHLYSDSVRLEASERWRIESEIRTGLDRNEFVLHYQPVVDLKTGTVAGVEALVRWQHGDELRAPDRFIAIAELSGLIVPLGNWILNEACRQGAEWRAAGHDLHLAVNFSARQIQRPDVLGHLDEVLASTGMDPRRLIVEITESTMLDEAEHTREVLEAIRGRGAGVAIDDFGTGYSSLIYLKRYPVRTLKVDRSFVSGLGMDARDDAIVSGVISFARAVGGECIAEGVETVGQLALLQALNCRYAQGYLFSPAVPASDIPSTLQEIGAKLGDLLKHTAAASMAGPR
jgi:EAL domain-containing protein (putative c-di-GMP-specific phosphodiesterase class I)